MLSILRLYNVNHEGYFYCHGFKFFFKRENIFFINKNSYIIKIGAMHGPILPIKHEKNVIISFYILNSSIKPLIKFVPPIFPYNCV